MTQGVQNGGGEEIPPVSGAEDAATELDIIRRCLRWLLLDQSTKCRAFFSWCLFLFLGVAIPAASHFFISLSRSATDAVVQVSLTAASAIAFWVLSVLTRHNRLHHLLSIDKLRYLSKDVRGHYTTQLGRVFLITSLFVVPLAAADVAHKVWWFRVAVRRTKKDTVAGVLGVVSWVYRTSTFYLVCVLFMLVCQLQILCLQDFAKVLWNFDDVAVVHRGHLRVQRQLRIITKRFQVFILMGIIIVTVSQLASVFFTTFLPSTANIFNCVELALCSIGLVIGILICLVSAAMITHKAQALTSHAARWHIKATMHTGSDPEAPSNIHCGPVNVGADECYEEDDARSEDELERTNLLQSHHVSTELEPTNHLQSLHVRTISFQKRQALVTYLENHKAGITIFGFVLDRTWIYGIFMLELSLLTWLLGKIIRFT